MNPFEELLVTVAAMTNFLSDHCGLTDELKEKYFKEEVERLVASQKELEAKGFLKGTLNR